MTDRIPQESDPYEDEGLASPESALPGKRITGDAQDEMAVPADRPVAVNRYGTTAAEEREGEPLDMKLAGEQPDVLDTDAPQPNYSDNADTPYPSDPEEKVGRLVATDEGAREDDEPTAVAADVGTDLGGFSAEERAMRIEPEP